MSRIGKKPISIPDGVNVNYDKDAIIIEGPKGKLTQKIHPWLKIEVDKEGKQVLVKSSSDEKKFKALHGLIRTLLANNVHGVTNGFSKDLEIMGLCLFALEDPLVSHQSL